MKIEKLSDVEAFFNSSTNLEKTTSLFNERTYRLDRMKMFMESMGNPQNSYKTIHIAGSKGKGSTAAFLASALREASFKTGLYMSPHVTDFRERFTVDGSFADEKTIISTARKIQDFAASFKYGEPTTFELYTAFAFLLFKETACDWAVIETGMGGRLDATNILFPVCSVLTPVELEHTAILGDTIEKIAVEKSKIIKKNTPVFVSLQSPEAMDVFLEESRKCSSPLFSLKDNLSCLETESSASGQKTEIVFKDGKEFSLSLSMPGSVQAYNCALSLLVLRTLGLYRAGVTEKALEKTSLPARAEMIKWVRPLLVDGAHTLKSMENILSTFRQIYPGRKGLCIFGCAQDKDYKSMLDMIEKTFDSIIICRPGTFKASCIEDLYSYLLSTKKEEQKTLLIPEAGDALKYVLENTEGDCPVLVCGSFYLAGVIKERL